MKYLDLFTGIGGFTLGIQQAYEELHNLRPDELADSQRPEELHDTKNELQQWECVGYSEIDKYASSIYQKHFPEHKNYGDITKINEEELPEFDLLVGGFPCQAFSIAGKRRGFDDTRGTLFFEIARIIKAKQPRLLLLENVKGLLSHDEGRTFATIISTLDELGYDLQWQVLNSKNFGVPQNRERVFIVGHLRGTSRPQVFPFTGGNGVSDRPNEIQTANTITTNYHKGVGGGRPFIKVGGILKGGRWDKQQEHSCRVYDSDGIAPTIPTAQGGNIMPKIIQKSQDWREDGSLRQFEKTSPTIRASMGDNHPLVTIAEGSIRRLTPTECERLQGFPDNWTGGVSDTQRYKTLGNAVTVNVIREIIKRLI